MSEQDSSVSKLAYFLVGGGIGAIIALLFAPRTGRETRDLIAQKATESKDRLSNASRDVSGKVTTYIERGKELVNTQKEQISAAIEAGKQAYREEKAKGSTASE